MQAGTQTFRVFISSTFADMKVERAALQACVFPVLRRYCQEREARFQAIDLRWGVSEEAARDQQTMRICLEELRRCQEVTPRPNFLILLGDRYGWRPLPEVIEGGEFEALLQHINPDECERLLWREGQPPDSHGWYRRDNNADPPVYYLVHREGDDSAWPQMERRLRDALVGAVHRMRWQQDDPRLSKYLDSATHQEINHGALGGQDPAGQAFCYLRAIPQIEQMLVEPGAQVFIDVTDRAVDREARQRLAELKATVTRRLPAGHIQEAEVSWQIIRDTQARLEECERADDPDAAIRRLVDDTPYLRAFCEGVLRDLQTAIDDAVASARQVSALAVEVEAHRDYAARRAVAFVGCTDLVGRIRGYLDSSSPEPLVLCGGAGTGKTALLGHIAALCASQYPDRVVVARYVGATPASISLRSLLQDIHAEIVRRYGGELDRSAGIPELVADLPNRLALATERSPLLLMVDAVDQIEAHSLTRALRWMPLRLPPFAKLIVSVADDDPAQVKALQRLRQRLSPGQFVQIGDLSDDEGAAIMKGWLAGAHRRLAPAQMDAVMDAFRRNRRPLLLQMLFEEARNWRHEDAPPKLPAEIDPLLQMQLARLERESRHGLPLTRKTLAYLCAARHGLTEDELLDILGLDEEVMADFRRRSPRSPKADRLPVVVWSRLHSDLAPYLAERRADGTTVIGFHHRQIRSATAKRCFADASMPFDEEASLVAVDIHRRLAAYFEAAPAEYSEPGGLPVPNRRKLWELPFHQALSSDGASMASTLHNPLFIEAKCRAQGALDLVQDYDRALARWPGDAALRQAREALVQSLPAVTERPEAAAQHIRNHLAWVADLTPATQATIKAADTVLNRRGPWLRACSPVSTARSDVIPFGMEARVQALSPDGRYLALFDGKNRVNIRDIRTGDIAETRVLNGGPLVRVSALALSEDGADLAWVDSDGNIQTDGSSVTLAARPGERLLAYHSERGVFAVRPDGALVAWDPVTGREDVLAEALPRPLKALRMTPDGRALLYLAGEREQTGGVVRWSGTGWQHQLLPAAPARIEHADISPDGTWMAAICWNRTLLVADVDASSPDATVAYERQGQAPVYGVPMRCALGTGPMEDWVFFATGSGQVARWQPQTGQVVAMEPYAGAQETLPLELFAVPPTSGTLLLTTRTEARMARDAAGTRLPSRHLAPVTRCLLTSTGKVVSVSRQDRTVRWFDFEGLQPIYVTAHGDPSRIATLPEGDDVLVASQKGRIWRQGPSDASAPSEGLMAFNEAVVDLFEAGDGDTIAVGQSGRALRIDRSLDRSETLWHATGLQEQLQALPAGNAGLCFSVRADTEREGRSWVVALVDRPDHQSAVFHTVQRIEHVAVAPDGAMLCVVDDSVHVLAPSLGQWTEIYHRSTRCSHACFVGGRQYLAVVLRDEPWLEVWRLADGLPTVAAAHMPAEVTCLTSRDDRLVVGLKTGPLLSLALSAAAPGPSMTR